MQVQPMQGNNELAERAEAGSRGAVRHMRFMPISDSLLLVSPRTPLSPFTMTDGHSSLHHDKYLNKIP